MDLAKAINDGLLQFNASLLGYLLDIGVISTLAMALLQAVKEMTNLRKGYNRKNFLAWLYRRAMLTERGSKDPTIYVSDAESELLRIATDRDEAAFYSGDIATMCTQFSGAAIILLDYPELSRQLFHLLTVNSKEKDVTLLLGARPLPPMPLLPSQPLSHEQIKEAAIARQQVIDARNRIRHQLMQSIASFQSGAGVRWERTMKFWAWFLSLVLTFIAGALAGWLTGPNVIFHCLCLLLASAVAGFLAPITRDLVAALEGLHP